MNHTSLVGRLVKDQEMRFIPSSGNAVTTFTIAVDRNYSKAKRDEAKAKGQPTADFIRIITWGKLAEICGNYLAKGKLVSVIGSIQTSTYKTQSGETRYATDVLANEVRMLDTKSSETQQNAPMHGGGSEEFNQEDFASIEDIEEIPF